jgi:trans-aconitate 2-methyltransferase
MYIHFWKGKKMKTTDWNPELYLKYNKERIQPSVDLISRIQTENPGHIIDIGCGPGNSTQILRQRWPNSSIVGVDNSEAMIKRARKDYPDMEWKLIDAGKDAIPGRFDIVFSNATIQWIPDHLNLFTRLRAILKNQGVIAIQIPLFFDMKIGQIIQRIAGNSRWFSHTGTVIDMFTIHSYSDYYDVLTGMFSSVEIYVTDYIHIMNSHTSILEMIKGAGLKPYLERLSDDCDKTEFEKDVLKDICNDYPVQKDGKVLFPFKRLFIIAC